MEMFCELLREHAMEIINFIKKIIFLTKKAFFKKKNYQHMKSRNDMKMQKYANFAKKSLKLNILKIKKYCKARDHCL